MRKKNSINMSSQSLTPTRILVKRRGNVSAGIPVSQIYITLKANIKFTKIWGNGIINYPEKKKYWKKPLVICLLKFFRYASF